MLDRRKWKDKVEAWRKANFWPALIGGKRHWYYERWEWHVFCHQIRDGYVYFKWGIYGHSRKAAIDKAYKRAGGR